MTCKDSFQALRGACRASHQGGPGGCAFCVCGAPSGGSPACAAYGRLRNLVHFIPTDKLPKEWTEEIAKLKELM